MIGAIVGGALGLGSAVVGAIGSAKQNRKARRLIQQQRAENQAWYKRKMAEDFTQRADSQAILNKQREMLSEQYQTAAKTNKIAGGTPEAEAIQKSMANRSLSNTMTNLASASAQHKDAVEQQYRSQDNAINQQQAQNYQQQAQNISQAASQVGNAGTSLLGTSSFTKGKW